MKKEGYVKTAYWLLNKKKKLLRIVNSRKLKEKTGMELFGPMKFLNFRFYCVKTFYSQVLSVRINSFLLTIFEFGE
jgi:hypothetical protein